MLVYTILASAREQFRPGQKQHIMESKILIDIDYHGKPQLKIVYKHSEDVRDKLVARLLEPVYHSVDGTQSRIILEKHTDTPDGMVAFIRLPDPVEMSEGVLPAP